MACVDLGRCECEPANVLKTREITLQRKKYYVYICCMNDVARNDSERA